MVSKVVNKASSLLLDRGLKKPMLLSSRLSKVTLFVSDHRHPSVEPVVEADDLGSAIMSSSVKSLAVAQPKKVLTSPFAQTLEQIAPTWPPFNPQSQKYMALGT